MKSGNEMGLNETKWQKLFNVGEDYWLASAYNSYYVWLVYCDGNVSTNRGIEFGVRPVVSLKSGVRTTGVDPYCTWEIKVCQKNGVL